LHEELDGAYSHQDWIGCMIENGFGIVSKQSQGTIVCSVGIQSMEQGQWNRDKAELIPGISWIFK
jgi:hypothetical protein